MSITGKKPSAFSQATKDALFEAIKPFVLSAERYSNDLIKIYSRYILQGNANGLISGVTAIYFKIEVVI